MSEVKIPRHIKAKTAEGLEKVMSDVSRLSGYQHINFEHIQFVDGDWYAWYLAKDEDLAELTLPRSS